MFYDLFCRLCTQRGITPTKAALEIGLSKSTATKWKQTGATPQGETLARVAAYFGVSADLLLGEAGKQYGEEVLDLLMGAARQLSRENQQKLLEMALFFAEQQARGK